MHALRATLLSLMFSACAATAEPVRTPEPARAPEAAGELAPLAWIEGHWRGNAWGGVMEEHWTAPEGGTMLGLNRLFHGGATSSFEYIRIAATDDGIVMVVQPGGGKATSFPLSRMAEREAVFSNPQHDFPRRISYRLEGDVLRIELEGDDGGQLREARFSLERVPR